MGVNAFQEVLSAAGKFAPTALRIFREVQSAPPERAPEILTLLEQTSGKLRVLLLRETKAREMHQSLEQSLHAKQSHVRRAMEKIAHWQQQNDQGASTGLEDLGELQDKLLLAEKDLADSEGELVELLQMSNEEQQDIKRDISVVIESLYARLQSLVRRGNQAGNPPSKLFTSAPCKPLRIRRQMNEDVADAEVAEWGEDHLEPALESKKFSQAVHFDMVWQKSSKAFSDTAEKSGESVPTLIHYYKQVLLRCRLYLNKSLHPNWDKACWAQTAEQVTQALEALRQPGMTVHSFRQWLSERNEQFLHTLAPQQRNRFRELCSMLFIDTPKGFVTSDQLREEYQHPPQFKTADSVKAVVPDVEEFERNIVSLLEEVVLLTAARRGTNDVETGTIAREVAEELWNPQKYEDGMMAQVKGVAKKPKISVRNVLSRCLSILLRDMRSDELTHGTRMCKARYAEIAAAQLLKKYDKEVRR